MGQIRTYQTDYLRQGTEQISFKRFTYDGTYQETIDANVLINCPEDVVPLNRSLQKLYEKPLKEVNFSTDLTYVYFKNENAQFLYDNRHWILGSTESLGLGDNEIISHDDQDVKSVSGNKYFKSTFPVDETFQLSDNKMIRNDHQYCLLKPNVPYKFHFGYYVDGTEGNNYNFNVRFFVQETYNADILAAGTKYYHFENEEWVDTSALIGGSGARVSTAITNNWATHELDIKPYEPSGSTVSQVYVGVIIFYPSKDGHSEAGGYTALYLDNLGIGQSVDATFKKIVAQRKQLSFAGTFTGIYESNNNFLSNQAKSTEFYIGKIPGNFERPRDSVVKTIEQIITQEIINDSRNYMTKYEGIFRNRGDINLGLHNKIWIDFGIDTLQEPVSCYIDAMKFDVKASQYDIRMHIPNQDDDVLTTYKVVAK